MKSHMISNLLRYNHKNYLLVGNFLCAEFISYLYFRLPPLLAARKILTATLVLFRAGDSFPACSGSDLFVCPLLDDFSSETRYANRPAYLPLDPRPAVPGTVSVSLDITDIVRQWVNGDLINKGLVLFTGRHCGYYRFGSASNPDNTLRPLLRIHYDPFPLPLIEELETTVELFPPPKSRN